MQEFGCKYDTALDRADMPHGVTVEDFVLQFSPKEFTRLIEQYGSGQDEAALSAGRRIRAGEYTRDNLSIIFEWKTKGRGRTRLKSNSDKEIGDALGLAVSAKTERSAIAVLLGLHGVHTPVASAILTAINPRRYTILDFRALESLGNKSSDRSVNFYLVYLDACRELAKTHGVSLRNFDRALWHWSDEQPRR
jgi:hypothetical protein